MRSVFFGQYPFTNLNIGNVHHGPDVVRSRHRFLSESDLLKLKQLFASGVRSEIRSLPTQDPLDLSPLLGVG